MIFQSTFASDPNRDILTEEELNDSTPYDGLAAKPTPSWYSGLGTGFFRGMGSGAIKSLSSAETAFANTGMTRAGLQMYEVETGESLEDLGIQDIEQREQEIVNRIRDEAKEHRRIAQREWGLENAGYGWAGELMYGLGETLPKAIGYSTLLGGLGAGFKAADITRGAFGALAYGADVGIGEYNTLRDKGVDENTAAWAGIATFGAGTIGLKIPATFGKSRLSSAVTGTLVNMGLSGAEVLSIGYILDNHDYTTLAKQYELDATNLLVAGVFGGVMGGALWRPEVNPQPKPKVKSEKKGYSNTREKFEDQLGKTGLYSRDEVSTQSILGDTFDALVEWAYGPNIRGVDVAPDVVLDEGSIGFNQIIGSSGGDAFYQSAFHGTPHIFDRFSTDHIGTGEGAQAHGWGLYFAGDRSVAEGYRNALAGGEILYKGKDINILYRQLEDRGEYGKLAIIEDLMVEQSVPSLRARSSEMIDDGSFTKEDFDWFEKEVAPHIKQEGRVFEVDIPENSVLLDEQKSFKEQPEAVQRAAKNLLERNETIRGKVEYVYGYLYGTDRLVMKFADREKTLGVMEKYYDQISKRDKKMTEAEARALAEEMSEELGVWRGHMKPAFSSMMRQFIRLAEFDAGLIKKSAYISDQYVADRNYQNMTGAQLYDALVRRYGSPKEASLALNKEGVKGITYDGQRDGRCYVVFDDKAVKTIDFYQRKQSRSVVEITGEEIAKEGTPLIELRSKAKDWYESNLRGKTVVNTQSGLEVFFANSRKAIATSANPEKLKLFFALESVIKEGEMSELIPVDPNRAKEQNIRGYRWITAPVKFDNKIVGVGVTVREDNRGRLYYNHNVIESETPLNSDFKPLTKQELEQRGTDDQPNSVFMDKPLTKQESERLKTSENDSSTEDDTLNIFVSQADVGGVALGSYSPTLNKIKLTPNANLSTFSHEMGHVYLNMAVEMASSTSSNLEFRNDVNKLLRAYGVKDAQEFVGFDLEAQRKVHEQFASHFEIYLSTGKAPKTGLQKIFDKIGLWLLAVYRYVGGPERAINERFQAEFGEVLPKPSDEVLEFLDKLFSRLETEADAEIKAKVPKVDNDMNAAARVVVQKVYTDKKFTAVAEKIAKGKRLTKKEREYAARMVQAGRMAEDQINEGEAVNVSNNLADMPANLRLIKDRSQTFVSGLSDNGVVLQNRDRSLPSSIAQMKSIAANPDYLRLGPSNFLSQGSPVIVNGDSIPINQRGNTSLMVDANGNRYEVQYAVIEADDVLTSNNIDGSVNAEYPTSNLPKAVSGNGRITGLKEAYRLKTADKYRSEMTQEKMTGVDLNVIKSMENPILVRIMKNEDVTNDIGDVSNRSESAQLSDVEQAVTDAQRLDLSAIRYGEDGDITRDSVVDFLQALPAEERARMIDASGNPTKSAFDRLDRAIMQAAYGNPNLTALLSTTEKTGISRLLSAARQIAPRVLDLEGEMDFRDSIVEVLGEIQNAKLSGAAVKLEDIAKQVNLTRSPEADAILQFLANNETNKGGIANIVEVFSELADFAHANIENAALGPDMFGEITVPTRKALMKKFSEITGVKINEEDFVRAVETVQKTVDEVVEDVKTKVDEAIEATDSLISDDDLQTATTLLDQAQDLEVQRAKAVEMLENPNKVSVENLALENPDVAYDFIDENGNKTKMTAQEVLEANERELAEANVQESALGRAVECVVNNNGV